MGLFDFVKDAGASLFGGASEKAAAPKRDLEDVTADKEKSKTLTDLVNKVGMKVEGLSVNFREGRATVSGQAISQTEREKIVVLIGNTRGVAQVDDQMTVAERGAPETPAVSAVPEVKMYTVQRGDTLSGIAKKQYGDAMKYKFLFEANRPMLEDPNKIYPGQVLRIPPLDG